MIYHRSIVRSFLPGLLLLISFSFVNTVSAQDGKALFQQKCASCHAPEKVLIGPALKGADANWDDRAQLHNWVRNSAAVIKSGYPRAVAVYNQFNKIQMTAFPELSDAQIDAIFTYVNNFGATKDPGPGGGSHETAADPSKDDNTLLYGILTIILAVIALILLQVNSNLRKLSEEKDGESIPEPVPFYRNKAYIATAAIIVFMFAGWLIFKGAESLGREKNYQPKQPIFYSHTVHAGVNQISCLYCHGNTMEGKQANIPSVNICMNCHMGITEYTKGPKLYNAEGKEIDGTAEIKKLHEYAGYDPATKTYNGKGKPIEWVRIHNLPDHVYFNHSQHVNAGKVQCQTCHGEIQKMGEVKQFADLSMGWCVNCHRETKVQFADNKFYSIYEKFHEDLKNKKIDSVTVEMIGGTECQKCHY